MAQPSSVVSEAAGAERLDLSRFTALDRRRLSAPGLRTFLKIADLWGFNEEQRCLVLGDPSRSTYHNWCKQAGENGAFTLGVDVLTRISAMLGIHQALSALVSDEHDGVEWLRQPHHGIVFGGHPPLHLITSGTLNGLMAVRRFLDAARGGLYMPPSTSDASFAPYEDGELTFR